MKIVRRCLNPCGHSALAYSGDCAEIADEFNELFTSVGENAARQAQMLALDFDLSLIVPPNPSTFETEEGDVKFIFDRVSKEQVKNTIINMPTNKAPGHDKVNMRVIKTCLTPILPVITDLFNTSLSSGCFPWEWKRAEVVACERAPIQRKGTMSPISLLPVLSKVLERIAHDQFVSYLTTNNMLSVHQSGNKKCHSTETLGILFISHLYSAIDEKKGDRRSNA
jgi:hypothetical protein